MRRADRRVALVALAAGACGDDRAGAGPDGPARDRFEQVGHADLGARGMNAALAVAGDTVYVGSRIDGAPILIVDVADPAAPVVVGQLGPPDQGLVGLSSRELRAIPDRDLLIVLNLTCSPELHGCGGPAAERDNLKLYDIADRRAPVLVGTYVISSSFLRPRSPHEMFVWRDPADPARILVHLTAPISNPTYEVVDVSTPSAPVRIAAWDPFADGGLLDPPGEDNLLHSISVSADGRTGYASHLQGGLFVLDLAQVAGAVPDPAIAMLTPPAQVLDWSPPEPAGPHSAVPVPGRDLLVVTDEVYPPPWGTGCPWGWMRVVDVADPTAPAIAGELQVAENQGPCAGDQEGVTYTAHNATVTEHLALITWHAAGVVAVDLSNPAAPAALATFLPEPLAAVTAEDPGLGGRPVAMWSYPVVDRGLIYVVDIRNGLYLLRYRGAFELELEVDGPLEGNSNLGG